MIQWMILGAAPYLHLFMYVGDPFMGRERCLTEGHGLTIDVKVITSGGNGVDAQTAIGPLTPIHLEPHVEAAHDTHAVPEYIIRGYKVGIKVIDINIHGTGTNKGTPHGATAPFGDIEARAGATKGWTAAHIWEDVKYCKLVVVVVVVIVDILHKNDEYSCKLL